MTPEQRAYGRFQWTTTRHLDVTRTSGYLIGIDAVVAW